MKKLVNVFTKFVHALENDPSAEKHIYEDVISETEVAYTRHWLHNL